MTPTTELINTIYIDKVMRARKESIEQRLADGPRLFAFACEAARAGIRMEHPNATPEQVAGLLRSRFELVERMKGLNRG